LGIFYLCYIFIYYTKYNLLFEKTLLYLQYKNIKKYITMKNLILFLMFFLLGNVVFSQSSKTFVKSFQLETNKVLFNIPGNNKVNYWDDNHIKIVFVAKVNLHEETLNQLVKAGRYDLETRIENNVTIIKFIKIVKDLTIKGEKITEFFDFEIFLPKDSEVVSSIDYN
jgi:hypothetical protein